jgi:hypothetical protein
MNAMIETLKETMIPASPYKNTDYETDVIVPKILEIVKQYDKEGLIPTIENVEHYLLTKGIALQHDRIMRVMCNNDEIFKIIGWDRY